MRPSDRVCPKAKCIDRLISDVICCIKPHYSTRERPGSERASRERRYLRCGRWRRVYATGEGKGSVSLDRIQRSYERDLGLLGEEYVMRDLETDKEEPFGKQPLLLWKD